MTMVYFDVYFPTYGLKYPSVALGLVGFAVLVAPLVMAWQDVRKARAVTDAIVKLMEYGA